ncbi:MAG: agmatine deiminase family protein [Gammaproteobacteria bacterium]|nr:agmatine deiminase family protein [Gammaproteobacteria bacterium]
MISRRRFLGRSGVMLAGAASATLIHGHEDHGPIVTNWFMPDEGAEHERTWMAFATDEAIWGPELVPEVQRNLALIANTIVRYEPVTMLVRPQDAATARELAEPAVELVPWPLNDLWMRDTGPLFVLSDRGGRGAVDFNFNGWGGKQVHSADARVATFVARRSGTPLLTTALVLEGGGIEVDGEGTAILTESCVLNANRNPGWSKDEVSDELSELLGLDNFIWLPGIRGEDITDGHVDFYARFAGPGTVVAGYEPDPSAFDHEVTERHLAILRHTTGRHGQPLDVVVLEAPATLRQNAAPGEFAAGYLGYYVCNGAVLMQEFGDSRADSAAQATLQQLYPDRRVIALNVDGIAAGGGSIHCATQQQPKAL